MKQQFLLLTMCVLATLFSSCTINKDSELLTQYSNNAIQETDSRIKEFEQSYIDRTNAAQNITRSTGDAGVAIRLIGYNTIVYEGAEREFVNRLWEDNKERIEELGGVLILDGEMRVYFPMREAIVEACGNTYTADSLGYIHNFPQQAMGAIKILGREQTSHSIHTEFNKEFLPSKIYIGDYAIVFDLGEKNLSNMNNNNISK